MSKPYGEIAPKVQAIQRKLSEFLAAGDQVFVSSSFQTHSIPLLHIIAGFEHEIPVVFIDTGYHFPETLTFVRQVCKDFGLDCHVARAPESKLADRDSNGELMFIGNPDGCCERNKVRPLDPWLESYDIWVSGIRREQTAFRSSLAPLQPGPLGTLKFLPLLDWTQKDVEVYRKLHDLPAHPLDPNGLLSIGCQPCTDIGPINLGMPGIMEKSDFRANRWLGMQKTECGLHLRQAPRRPLSER